MDTQEATIFTAVVIASIILGIIISFFVLSIVQQQKRTNKLQQAKILAEISAMEKERERIAADLHDDIGPILSVVKLHIDDVHTTNTEEEEQLKIAIKYIDDLATRIREISSDLMPNALIRKGLKTALVELKDRVERSSGLEILFFCPDTSALSQQISIQVFRIIQELMHNSLRHAHASLLKIDISVKGKTLQVFFQDNGRGFDYPLMEKQSTGIGLKSLKNRAELMGGSLKVESVISKGSAFLFEFPLTQ
jgi:two-component system, NarL family, sensor kinase